MAEKTFNPGDRVRVIESSVTHSEHLGNGFYDAAPVVEVVRQMPDNPDEWELSNGTIRPTRHLYLVAPAKAKAPAPDVKAAAK